MPFRPTNAALVFLLGLAACSEPRPWHEPGWTPTTPPQRIVAGSVLAAEVLLELQPGERLVAVHEVAADPAFSLVAGAVAGLHTVGAEPEQLLSARPDLVLVDAFTRTETLALLEAADVPVVRTIDPHGFADIAHNLRLIGCVTHLAPAAEHLVQRMQEQLALTERAGRTLPEWRVLGLDGALHTYGRGSLFDAVVIAAGARNVAAEEGVGAFRKLDIEEVLAWRPDAIVLSLAHGTKAQEPEWLRQMPGMNLLACVQKGRLVFVSSPLLVTTSHRLVDAASEVQRQLRQWGKP